MTKEECIDLLTFTRTNSLIWTWNSLKEGYVRHTEPRELTKTSRAHIDEEIDYWVTQYLKDKE